ncbi:hypothetical protein GCM10010193_37000 [Kitasatospora atroaurantiaca]|uniref:Peptidase inhibitor family I36 n=1 Tax=Kitasatospora atroaurantiaca TaxID=285545 RepID=A0A561ET40_9ACTN|nr:hypothetical protein [Kitasatospora atroaurantiaca]TWE18757.1 hypothetical protein FB465_3846 [Kitasatospora atroaurantiaca]
MRVLLDRLRSFSCTAALLAAALIPSVPPAAAAAPAPLQVYGAWQCSDDACTWGTVRDMADFDHNNHWLIDRGKAAPPSTWWCSASSSRSSC